MNETGLIFTREGEGVIVLDVGTTWAATLANVAEHVARNVIGDWPRDEERYWPTEKAMEMEA